MIADYRKALKRGEQECRSALAHGQYPYLTALEDFMEESRYTAEQHIGIKEVPLSMIVGTKTAGRQKAFSCGFMPILKEGSEFSAKWSQLYDIQEAEGFRDPIKVYEYLQRFYVQEGNKRVSVLKYLGATGIYADITRLLPRKSEDKEHQIYEEFMEFYEVAPIYGITFSEPGGYKKLAEYLGLDLTKSWDEETVRDVRQAYELFDRLFTEKGGEKLSNITVGDALLLYLEVYGFDSLGDANDAVIRKNMDTIWKELLLETREDKIALVETPQEEAKSNVFMDILKMTQNPSYSAKNPLKIAFIYDRNVADSRWVYMHELGRNSLTESFGDIVQTAKYENCSTEELMELAVDDAVANGAQMIFTVFPSQMNETLRTAVKYPKVKFLNCSVNLSSSAVRTYYARVHEAKFIMGAIAASTAENHKLGYVADYPIYGTLAGINAFAIGAALVDPWAKVYLSWSTKAEGDWHQEMRDRQVDVVSGPDIIKPHDASRAYGIYKLDGYGGIANLAAPVINWGHYYELIVQTVLNGTWDTAQVAEKNQAINYWYGMSAGVIDVFMSDRISYYSVKLANMLKKALVDARIQIFGGELHSQTGLVAGADNEGLSGEQIVKMDWLNDNVIGEIPAMEELVSGVQEVVSMSGVKKS
ncbi:MAG: BMP family ABC transporter substrate-binding protein [Lachnospiraceae bacterium]|nr:BMP family ABC transporter substrate-binding protein [Lachnospiraceae bacterium]